MAKHFSDEDADSCLELLDRALAEEERRRHTDLVSRLRIARIMADGSLKDEAGA